jgi:lipid-A-disaccharide synthase
MPGESHLRGMIIVGESSGDLYGSELAKSLKELNPDIRLEGIAGPKMRRAGVEPFFFSEDVTAIGFVEVFGKIPFLWGVYQALKKRLSSGKYSFLLLVDFPGFNLFLAKAAKKFGIPVIYYISPQVWAWRRGRVKKIRKRVDKMFVILPFEEEFYRDTGVNAEFVGHPLIGFVKPSRPKEEMCRQFSLDEKKPVVGLLPGSRKTEIRYMFPHILKAAEMIKKQIPEVQFVLPLAETLDKKLIEEYLGKNELGIRIIKGFTYDTIHISDFLIAVSGTVTLEAGLLGKPMVIMYRGSFVSWILAEMLRRVPFFGLVNLIAGKMIVPELKQYQANPKRIAEISLKALQDTAYRDSVSSELLKVKSVLGEPGVSLRCAQKILDFLENRKNLPSS